MSSQVRGGRGPAMVKTAAMSVAALKTAMKTAAVCRDPEEAARSLAACVSEGTPVLLQSAVAGADDLAASVREQARRICGPQSLYPARASPVGSTVRGRTRPDCLRCSVRTRVRKASRQTPVLRPPIRAVRAEAGRSTMRRRRARALAERPHSVPERALHTLGAQMAGAEDVAICPPALAAQLSAQLPPVPPPPPPSPRHDCRRAAAVAGADVHPLCRRGSLRRGARTATCSATPL